MTIPPTPPRRRRAAPAVALASLALLAVGGFALAPAASGALIDVPETGAPGHLVLSSDPLPAEFLDLSPGDPGYWQVAARLEDATRATLQLELRKSGALVEHPRGLTMTVDACTQPWTDAATAPACPVGAQRVAVATPAENYASASPRFDLAPLTPEAPAYLLITLAVEDSPEAMADESLMSLTGDMGVGLTAVAVDDVPVPPGTPGASTTPGSLARTGADLLPVVAAAAFAAGLLGLGLAFRLSRKGLAR